MVNYDKDSRRRIRTRWFKETRKKLAECLPAIDAATYNIAQYDPALWKDDCPTKLLEDYYNVVSKCGQLISQMNERLMRLNSSYTQYCLDLYAHVNSRKEERE